MEIIINLVTYNSNRHKIQLYHRVILKKIIIIITIDEKYIKLI